ncbi:hypothetical protein, variant [Aphanomyces astaci]|uniref:Orc1-like AAA ATPase domain-containing protein n=1 Tax=Aphanomyces astaci TaxID=112090 RepID=W4GVN1_APHAT|nr:hypothetical protein, variant [Aphanomyces astaci]ETV83381.1 hypothetical protein, variant [Aphanomyces astaci]|eukprot:XP_009826811.1 hypothetical protein, variant [Aphanomyces astaci]
MAAVDDDAAAVVDGLFDAIWSSLEVEGWSKTKYSHGQLYLAPDADLMNFKMTVNVFERKRPALVLALELTNPPNTPNAVAIWDIVSAFLISAKCVSRIMLSAQATWYCSPRVENLAHLVPNVTMFETQRGATLKYLCSIFPESVALKSSFAQDGHAASSPQAAMPTVLPSPVGINDANTPSTCTLDSNDASLSPNEIPMEAIWRVLETWQWTRQETSARTWSYMHPTLTSPIHTDVGLRRYLGTSGLMRDVATAALTSNSPIDRARTITRPPRPAMPMTAKTKKKKAQPRPKLVLGEIEDGLHQLGWKSFEGSLGTVYCKPHVVVFAGGRLKVASCSGVHGVDFFIGSTSLVEYVRGTPALEASVRHVLASDTVVEAESVPTAAPQPPSSSRAPPLPATAALCPAPTLRSHGHKTSSSKAQFAAVFQELTKLGWTRRPSTLGYSYCKPPTDDLNEPTEFFSSADVEAYVRASGEWDRIEQLVQRKRSQRHRVVDDDSCDDVWAQLKAKGWTRKRLADGEVEFHAPLDGQHATSAEPVVMPGRKRRRRQRPADRNDDNMGEETKARMTGESDELAPQTTVASTLEGDEHRVELSTLVHEDRSSEPAQVEMIVLPEPCNNEECFPNVAGDDVQVDETMSQSIISCTESPASLLDAIDEPALLPPCNLDATSVDAPTDKAQDNETQATEHLSRDLPDDHLAKKGSSPLTTPPNNSSSLHDLFMDGEFISLHDVLDDVATAENEPLMPSSDVSHGDCDQAFEGSVLEVSSSSSAPIPPLALESKSVAVAHESDAAMAPSACDNNTRPQFQTSPSHVVVVGSCTSSTTTTAPATLDAAQSFEAQRTSALDALSPRYRLKSLVGRDVQWQAAMAFVARSFAVGCGSVCVSGPRGTGKSALVALLEEQVAAECAGRGRQLRPRHVDMSASVPRTSSLFVELANEMTNVQYASDADAMSALEETCRDPSWLTYEHDSPPRSIYFLDCC